jgi:hypothetical protein
LLLEHWQGLLKDRSSRVPSHIVVPALERYPRTPTTEEDEGELVGREEVDETPQLADTVDAQLMRPPADKAAPYVGGTHEAALPPSDPNKKKKKALAKKSAKKPTSSGTAGKGATIRSMKSSSSSSSSWCTGLESISAILISSIFYIACGCHCNIRISSLPVESVLGSV